MFNFLAMGNKAGVSQSPVFYFAAKVEDKTLLPAIKETHKPTHYQLARKYGQTLSRRNAHG